MSNDRFKFRVWDKRKKKYVDRYVIGDDGMAYKLHDAGEDSYDLIPDEEVIIEQCTGLRDKNGKLIFEGDVLQDGENVAAVVWNIDQYLLEDRDGYVGEFSLFAKTFEVVGNIHEGSWINE